MTSLAEAERKFGEVVRNAGGAIFGIEKSPSTGSRQDEKLRIGTADGFVKIAVSLEQPNIGAVLRERTAILVRHAEELRKCSGLIHGRSSMPRKLSEGFEHVSNASPRGSAQNDADTKHRSTLLWLLPPRNCSSP